MARSQRPPVIEKFDRERILKSDFPKLKKDNLSLTEFVTAIDFRRWALYSEGPAWDRQAILEILSKIPDTYKAFINTYLTGTVVWDDFLAQFHCQFYDVNILSKEVDTLNKAKQGESQRVNSFAHYVKSQSVRANITDDKQLGRIFYNGLLKEIYSAARGTVPADGFTFDAAVAYAVEAERVLDSIKYATKHKGNNSHKNNNNNLVSSVSMKHTKPNARENIKQHNFAKKAKLVRPAGTPTGTLYLVRINSKKQVLHSSVQNHRLNHNPVLCTKCGHSGHVPADCTTNLNNTDPAFIEEVAEDFIIPTKVNITLAAANIDRGRLTSIKI